MAREYLKQASVPIQKRKADVEATVRAHARPRSPASATRRSSAMRAISTNGPAHSGSRRPRSRPSRSPSRRSSRRISPPATRNVVEFAKRQKDSIQAFEVELYPGAVLGQKLIPVATVGCYIPGGKYPLISAAIMSVGTAKVAGVGHIIALRAAARARRHLSANALCAARSPAPTRSIASAACRRWRPWPMGCVGMPKADMITGPGNAYVAEAKRQLFGICRHRSARRPDRDPGHRR